MITGGADSKIHPLSLVRISLLDQMSRWKGTPAAGGRRLGGATGGVGAGGGYPGAPPTP